MRTTIELDDHLRGQLLDLAAQRGLKGFSTLIEEAVQSWLQTQAGQQEALRNAAALMGTLTNAEAATLQNAAERSREAIAPRTWE